MDMHENLESCQPVLADMLDGAPSTPTPNYGGGSDEASAPGVLPDI